MAKKSRSSNIELFRIVMMLLIIAHHLVVNSGVTSKYDFGNVTVNMIFLQLFGFAGKPMIDGFLLITGYFSVKGKFTPEKALRVFLEICFYKVGFYLLFGLLGIGELSVSGLINTALYVFKNGNSAFPATYFWLYLLTPFINTLVLNLDKRKYLGLLSILLFYFSVISTVFKSVDTFSELGWYITVYLIGGYLRLYEPKLLSDCCRNGLLTAASLLACFASILLITNGHIKGTSDISIYYYVSNANKPFGLLLAICAFQWFRHMPMKRAYKAINIPASSVFGVLLIHGNGDTMRTLLWKNWLDIQGHYDWKWLPIYAIVCVIGIFIVCTAIDQLRIHLLETPFFKLYNKVKDSVLLRLSS